MVWKLPDTFNPSFNQTVIRSTLVLLLPSVLLYRIIILFDQYCSSLRYSNSLEGDRLCVWSNSFLCTVTWEFVTWHITYDAETSPDPISTRAHRHSYICLTISDLQSETAVYEYVQNSIRNTFRQFSFINGDCLFCPSRGKAAFREVLWMSGQLAGGAIKWIWFVPPYWRHKPVCRTLTREQVGPVHEAFWQQCCWWFLWSVTKCHYTSAACSWRWRLHIRRNVGEYHSTKRDIPEDCAVGVSVYWHVVLLT